MVKKGMGNQEVEKILKDTNSGKKNEILFNEFGINYNSIEEVYRRGTFFMYVEEKIEIIEEKA
jgi:tRNA(His) guanylyltransferase